MTESHPDHSVNDFRDSDCDWIEESVFDDPTAGMRSRKTCVIRKMHTMDDDIPEVPETRDEKEARLAWYQVITIQESITPPAVFRPAQRYCWDNKPAAIPSDELIAIVGAFPDDKSLRQWVQNDATPVQVYALWEAIAELSRRFFLLDDHEKPDPRIVAEVRSRPSAKDIFNLALRLPPRE